MHAAQRVSALGVNALARTKRDGKDVRFWCEYALTDTYVLPRKRKCIITRKVGLRRQTPHYVNESAPFCEHYVAQKLSFKKFKNFHFL